MFDIGWSELLVIGVVALIVVGPKDLPRMFRTLGEVTGKARKMAREFQSAMNDAAKESGMDDVSADLRKLANPKKYGIDKLREATGELSAWSPDAADGKAKPGLSAERATSKAKTDAAMAAKAQARLDSEAAELSEEPELMPDPAAPRPATAEPAADKGPASEGAATKVPVSKAATSRNVSGNPTASKAGVEKPVAAKAAAAKRAAPKAAAAKPAKTKPAASKPAASKSARSKSAEAASGPAKTTARKPASAKPAPPKPAPPKSAASKSAATSQADSVTSDPATPKRAGSAS